MKIRELLSQKLPLLLGGSIILLCLLVVMKLVLSPKSESKIEKIEQTQIIETTIEETTTDLIDYGIYDQELMKANKIDKMNFDEYTSIDQVIQSVIEDYGIYTDNISISYYDFINGEEYQLNSPVYRVAASTVKIPYSVIFFDLLDQGAVALNTQIPYMDAYYAERNGNVTNGTKQASYDLSYVLYEMLVNSDNTSAVMVYVYYEQYFGDMETSMAASAGMSDMPGEFYYQNYLSADFLMNDLKKMATESKYASLVKTMMEPKNPELFISYVKKGMANKFGRFEATINDAGIYYENDQPQYALVCMTEKTFNDAFLEVLNLRVNEWHRYQQTQQYKDKHASFETTKDESAIDSISETTVSPT